MILLYVYSAFCLVVAVNGTTSHHSTSYPTLSELITVISTTTASGMAAAVTEAEFMKIFWVVVSL